MAAERLKPNYLFEVSWEVCNKVGGIYTVLATKAQTLESDMHEQYMLIGPDVWKGTGSNPEFIEDKTLFRIWRQYVEQEGLKVKIGRWNIPGRPVAMLVDYTPYFFEKNEIFKEFWVKYQLDSLTGQWDYIEPALFGYAAGRVIESFYNCHINSTDRVVAQFHEWMTGAGILYIEDHIPQIATMFTTHATVLGRAIAGSGRSLYKDISTYDPDSVARESQVIAKHSLEKVSATNADCFTTVSELTATECRYFLEKSPDIITPNGFDAAFVPNEMSFNEKRAAARTKIIKVAESLFGQRFPENSLLVIKSGRYEFKNKGIDIFLDSLAQLNKYASLERNIIAIIFVPGHCTGPRKDLVDRMVAPTLPAPKTGELLTHNLQGTESDPIVKRVRENGMNNIASDKVKLIYVPTYMDGSDGIFNLQYYDLLIGFDISVFPSYYEPWGYTPLESIAFHIPAITTNISGFGTAVEKNAGSGAQGVYVINRTDDNDNETVKAVSDTIFAFSKLSAQDIVAMREKAFCISQFFLWERQISFYLEAYDFALRKSVQREMFYRDKPQALPVEALPMRAEAVESAPLWREVVVVSEFPQALSALQRLSRNMWWSWNDDAIALFESIDPGNWRRCHCNAVAFLQTLSYSTLKKLEHDKEFLDRLGDVVEKFEKYTNENSGPVSPFIAYFSMEYGIDNALKTYSGGLGILAGDLLKEASDEGASLVAIGLLYRQGYFRQTLSIHGEQVAEPDPPDISTLPLEAVCKEGKPVKISLAFPGRAVSLQAWKLAVGRVSLYLLDTFVEENEDNDKLITSRLYPSSEETRLQQQIILGIGGVNLLSAIGIKPDVYHCNEGHTAFVGVARLRDLIVGENLSFEEAMEVTRATTLFTTHTSLAAAMDTYSEEMLRPYFSHTILQYNIDWQTFMGLGKSDAHSAQRFSMPFLAAKMSVQMNAVSKIHRKVSCKLFNVLWKDYSADELYTGYITNGVHYATWVAKDWKALSQEIAAEPMPADPSWAKRVWTIPDEKIWEIRLRLKRILLESVRRRLAERLSQHHEGPRKIAEAISHIGERALVIGFARRFVTYKRPALVLSDPGRLYEILNNSGRPVLLFFSGKAHPGDTSGADIIRSVVEVSERSEFKNRIFFLEDYDMNLARLLVQGVDLWMNVPNRGMEASGTSGMKALMNGVLNFSVLDGWWPEAYDENMGWALEEEASYEVQNFQDELDSEKIYKALENEIIPLYFRRDNKNLPLDWIHKIKAALSVAPGYTMARVLAAYRDNYYRPLYKRGSGLIADNFKLAKDLAAWKGSIRAKWKEVDVLAIEPDLQQVSGKAVPLRVTLWVGDLTVNDLGVEVIFRQKSGEQNEMFEAVEELIAVEITDRKIVFEKQLPDLQPGSYSYCFRIFPKHPLLPHRQDFSLVKWV